MEIKKVKSEQIGEPVHSSDRAVWLRRYKVDKVKVFRDGSGVVESEQPFSEFVYSLFVLGKTLWIREDLMFSVREVLGFLLEEGDFSSASITKFQVMAATQRIP